MYFFLAILFFFPVWARILSFLPSRQAKEVCLTFDDGPSPTVTPKILAILKKYKIPATFFVLGQQAKRYPHLLRAIVHQGHVLGNHSYSHPFLPKLSASAQEKELSTTLDLLIPHQNSILWFRPPYGAYNHQLAKLAQEKNMSVVLWSVDPQDWKKPSANILRQRILKGLRPGAIILLHDIHMTTAAALEQIIQDILARGYKFVPLS